MQVLELKYIEMSIDGLEFLKFAYAPLHSRTELQHFIMSVRTGELLQWPDEYQIGGLSIPLSIPSSAMRRGRPKISTGVIWTVERTLELLDAMKVYVRNNKLKCIGIDIKHWQVIAIHLPNPLDLELHKYARSCEVQYYPFKFGCSL